MDGYIFTGKREQPVNQRPTLSSRLQVEALTRVVELRGAQLGSPRAWTLNLGPLLVNMCLCRKVSHPPGAFRDSPSMHQR